MTISPTAIPQPSQVEQPIVLTQNADKSLHCVINDCTVELLFAEEENNDIGQMLKRILCSSFAEHIINQYSNENLTTLLPL